MIAWRQSQLQSVNQITESSKNVGDLLNAKGITWGWFQGGFVPTGVDIQGRAVCGQHHAGLAGDDAIVNAGDYIRTTNRSCITRKPQTCTTRGQVIQC